MSALLEARDLRVSIGDTRVCSGLGFSVAEGERLVILGRNGVGKSTLLKTLAGLRPSQGGVVCCEGVPLEAFAPRRLALLRGYLPQQLEDPFSSSVLETALIGRHPHLGFWDWESLGDRRLAEEALAAVELSGFAQREVHTLSGGERQRLGLAMLLVQAPRLFLLDEPLAHLDVHHALAALRLMREQTAGAAAGVVAVLHDANLARRWGDRALLLFGDGEYAEGPVGDVIHADNLSRLYCHAVRALDDGGVPWFVPIEP